MGNKLGKNCTGETSPRTMSRRFQERRRIKPIEAQPFVARAHALHDRITVSSWMAVGGRSLPTLESTLSIFRMTLTMLTSNDTVTDSIDIIKLALFAHLATKTDSESTWIVAFFLFVGHMIATGAPEDTVQASALFHTLQAYYASTVAAQLELYVFFTPTPDASDDLATHLFDFLRDTPGLTTRVLTNEQPWHWNTKHPCFTYLSVSHALREQQRPGEVPFLVLELVASKPDEIDDIADDQGTIGRVLTLAQMRTTALAKGTFGLVFRLERRQGLHGRRRRRQRDEPLALPLVLKLSKSLENPTPQDEADQRRAISSELVVNGLVAASIRLGFMNTVPFVWSFVFDQQTPAQKRRSPLLARSGKVRFASIMADAGTDDVGTLNRNWEAVRSVTAQAILFLAALHHTCLKVHLDAYMRNVVVRTTMEEDDFEQMRFIVSDSHMLDLLGLPAGGDLFVRNRTTPEIPAATWPAGVQIEDNAKLFVATVPVRSIDGSGFVASVIDFGIAKSIRKSRKIVLSAFILFAIDHITLDVVPERRLHGSDIVDQMMKAQRKILLDFEKLWQDVDMKPISGRILLKAFGLRAWNAIKKQERRRRMNAPIAQAVLEHIESRINDRGKASTEVLQLYGMIMILLYGIMHINRSLMLAMPFSDFIPPLLDAAEVTLFALSNAQHMSPEKRIPPLDPLLRIYEALGRCFLTCVRPFVFTMARVRQFWNRDVPIIEITDMNGDLLHVYERETVDEKNIGFVLQDLFNSIPSGWTQEIQLLQNILFALDVDLKTRNNMTSSNQTTATTTTATTTVDEEEKKESNNIVSLLTNTDPKTTYQLNMTQSTRHSFMQVLQASEGIENFQLAFDEDAEISSGESDDTFMMVPEMMGSMFKSRSVLDLVKETRSAMKTKIVEQSAQGSDGNEAFSLDRSLCTPTSIEEARYTQHECVHA